MSGQTPVIEIAFVEIALAIAGGTSRGVWGVHGSRRPGARRSSAGDRAGPTGGAPVQRLSHVARETGEPCISG